MEVTVGGASSSNHAMCRRGKTSLLEIRFLLSFYYCIYAILIHGFQGKTCVPTWEKRVTRESGQWLILGGFESEQRDVEGVKMPVEGTEEIKFDFTRGAYKISDVSNRWKIWNVSSRTVEIFVGYFDWIQRKLARWGGVRTSISTLWVSGP